MAGLMVPWSRAKEKTLLAGWLVALWGPLTYGLAVWAGRSTLMVADLLRRITELAALFVSWYVYNRARRHGVAPGIYARWEKRANMAVAAVMLFSASFIGYQAYRQLQIRPMVEQVHWGILIAFLGVLVNGWFWRRHASFARDSYSPISESQYRLFRSKCLLDAWVVINLSSASYLQQWPWGRYLDPLGALVPACVLLVSAVQIFRIHTVGKRRKAP